MCFENSQKRGFNVMGAVFSKENIPQKARKYASKTQHTAHVNIQLELVCVQPAEKKHDGYETPEEDGPSNRCLVVG